RQGRVGPEEIPPKSISQAGMVEALGVTQGALTGCLSRLVAAGILRVQRSHVRGHDRRVKVYELTSKGEELVRELRRRTPPRPSNPIDPSRSGAFPSHRD
ncbi:MAG TPA: hypothetical protein VGV64_08020, partial [Thermoplasmata archaeon]|nr:hypothetical protein [Thermoplasmata archaeon]